LFELSTLLTFPWIAIIVIPIEIASSFVANYVIVKKTDVNQLRVATIEYQSFMKEYRQAVMQKDQAKVDKLKKKMKSVQDPYMKAQRERMRVSFSYLFPLTLIYFALAFAVGFRTLVAVSPYKIPALPLPQLPFIEALTPFHSGFGMPLFTWYFLTYTAVNLLISRLMGTTWAQ
jgi:uncharacterized membrane protein (DUF106 family)